MFFALTLPRQTARLVVRCSPKNRCHGQANRSHCCLVLGCLLVESPRPRIYRIRGNRCTNSTAKSIGFVSSVRSINRCNITLFCDNPRTSQQPLGIFATWKRFLYHFLAFLFSVFVHHHLHNSSNFAAKIHLFPNTASLYITFLAWTPHHPHFAGLFSKQCFTISVWLRFGIISGLTFPVAPTILQNDDKIVWAFPNLFPVLSLNQWQTCC